MNKCIGCGAILTSDITKEGYTASIGSKLCERCFRIRNYNEYQVVIKDNADYIDILKSINVDSLVILVVDLLNINNRLFEIGKVIKNNVLLVLTKYDLIPFNNEEKIMDFFKPLNLNIVDTVIISSQNNYHFDELYQKIKQYKSGNKVYVIGYTNAGKSSMINKLIYNYSNNIDYITTSNLPSTTLNTIEIGIDDFILVDTPGLLDDNICNYVDSNLIKKIVPKRRVKPITYQIKSLQTIIVEDILMICCDKVNLTLYFSNQLRINRVYKNVSNNLKTYRLQVYKGQEIVILGLGFIHVANDAYIEISVIGNTSVFVRNSLIGGKNEKK